jgi:hypothetical protein
MTTHYAILNNKNIVVQVITGNDDDNTQDWEQFYSNELKLTCKKTSKTKQFRKNYAGIGYKYDVGRDAFISPQPYASWILDEQTCTWCAPVAKPNDNKIYFWEEYTKQWIEINP